MGGTIQPKRQHAGVDQKGCTISSVAHHLEAEGDHAAVRRRLYVLQREEDDRCVRPLRVLALRTQRDERPFLSTSCVSSLWVGGRPSADDRSSRCAPKEMINPSCLPRCVSSLWLGGRPSTDDRAVRPRRVLALPVWCLPVWWLKCVCVCCDGGALCFLRVLYA